MSISILGKSYDTNKSGLYLGYSYISELPESIGELVNLKDLVLYWNKLTTLPESIGNLVNLKNLYLEGNQLTTLPESIGKLINLKELRLTHNRLTYLPKSIVNIKNSLDISVNSYEINNLSVDTEFLIFSQLYDKLTNLPTGLKEILVREECKNVKLNHKIPFGCVIKYF
jgi:Leucine-rich repeat (LRR) protein